MNSLPINYSKAFKAYDIRWLRESEINETFAYILWLALGSQYTGKSILIWCDTRPQNPQIIEHLITGLNQHNIQATIVNLQPTNSSPTNQPLPYGTASASTIYQLMPQYDLGIIISASHNPAWYVGFKVVQSDLVFIQTSILKEYFETTLAQLGETGEITLNTKYHTITSTQLTQAQSTTQSYFENIKSWITIAVDYSNGAAITYEQQFLCSWATQYGHTLIEMNTGADGLFTNHSSDTSENINYQQLITAVLWDQADIGILFDGDADRIGVVTSSWQIIPGDLVLSIIAQQLWVSGEQMVFDAMCGNSIRRAITASGNTPVVCKMGRFFINEKMKQIGAILGGEISWHIMFHDCGDTENVIVAISYLLKAIQQHGSLDTQVAKLTTNIYREPMLNLHVERKDEILSALMEHFADLNPLQIDGVNIYSDTMCMTARKSNTEPIIRIQLETADKAQYQQIITEIKEIVEKIEWN
jgi:phosphomannomutase